MLMFSVLWNPDQVNKIGSEEWPELSKSATLHYKSNVNLHKENNKYLADV